MDLANPARLTRIEFLKAAGTAAAGFVTVGADTPPAVARWQQHLLGPTTSRASRGSGQVLSFHSQPDLHPPSVTVRHGPEALANPDDGYWFLTPARFNRQSGPMIGDEHGSPVWFRPVGPNYFATNLRVQEYRGEPVLTWWEGTPFGLGEGVIMDSSYREIARIRAHKGQVDPHELVLTREGTALFFCYSPVPADLSSVGGSKDGQVLDPAIQEIDVQTGRLLMEWRGIDHIAVSESYVRPGGIYDFMHANSISVTPDGNLLV